MPEMEIGSAVRICDGGWYDGRMGTIAGSSVFDGVRIHTVHVLSGTGNGVISMAIRESNLVRVVL